MARVIYITESQVERLIKRKVLKEEQENTRLKVRTAVENVISMLFRNPNYKQLQMPQALNGISIEDLIGKLRKFNVITSKSSIKDKQIGDNKAHYFMQFMKYKTDDKNPQDYENKLSKCCDELYNELTSLNETFAGTVGSAGQVGVISPITFKNEDGETDDTIRRPIGNVCNMKPKKKNDD